MEVLPDRRVPRHLGRVLIGGAEMKDRAGTPRPYKMTDGNIIFTTMHTYSKSSEIWNDPHFIIRAIRQYRPHWRIKVFRRTVFIPKPYKIWGIMLMYKSQEAND